MHNLNYMHGSVCGRWRPVNVGGLEIEVAAHILVVLLVPGGSSATLAVRNYPARCGGSEVGDGGLRTPGTCVHTGRCWPCGGTCPRCTAGSTPRIGPASLASAEHGPSARGSSRTTVGLDCAGTPERCGPLGGSMSTSGWP